MERGSYDKLINKFIMRKKKNNRTYYHNTISEKLVEEKTNSLLKSALASGDRDQRISAIVQLGKWANSSFELDVLERLYKNEPDLELKSVTSNAILQIKNRI